jgi:fucose permease
MEEKVELKNANFSNVFRLLKDRYLLSLFFCILLIVGIDIGMNFFIPIIFSDVFGLEHATNINTWYFTARAVGSLLCALMLVRFSPKKILMWTMIVSILAYLLMMGLASTPTSSVFVMVLFCLMFLPVGFATANVFAIVFSFALQYKPENADQISSLLIMGVAGGGAITFSMGIISDTFGIVGGMSVLLLCMIYILMTSIYILRKKM